MIDRVIEFSIRNRTLVIVAGLVLAAWGVIALVQTPVDAVPDLSENQIIVFTDWLGHSPREIEDQITYPLSLNLQGLEGVKIVRSSSDFNFSSINVIFDDSLDFSVAHRRVADRLARLSDLLPAGATPQLAPEALATGQIFWYTIEGAGYDLGRLRAIQDWYVKPQLASVPGVAEVASVGGYPIEFQIEVDPNRLRAHGVTIADVIRAVSRSNSAVGGHVVQKANAEFIVRGVGGLGMGSDDPDSRVDPTQILRDIERIAIGQNYSALTTHRSLILSDVAGVSLGGQPRRGVLEKDGNEVTGGVVLMRYGENPLEVTQRIKEKIVRLQPGLPSNVRIVTGYDRTPLIRGAIGTVTWTLVEAIVTASICVLIVLLHFRTSFIIAVTLPLATLASFVIMWTLRRLGIADIQTNIMSLAGIAISIGVLVDSSIVMAENVMHSLRQHFGDRPVRGDIRRLVLPACRTVGRPIFFSVLIMLISFTPVFALGGMEGKMFRPLAFTKSFALAAVAVLAITLVPALCTVFIKGRLRCESDSWLVRSFSEVYRPVLNYLLDHPAVMAWIMGVTCVVGLAPVGNRWLFLGAVFLSIVACGLVPSHKPEALAREGIARPSLTRRVSVVGRIWRGRGVGIASLILIALVADQNMTPLGREFMTPLDEGTAMDMPITVPRASVNQSADDLKARDMILCRFPEVEMVMGKAGRAETATDPAPMDMIETMVSFRAVECWPRRRLLVDDAKRQARAVLAALGASNLIELPADRSRFDVLADEAVMETLPQFDNVMREFAYLKNQEFNEELTRRLGGPHSQQTADSLGRQRTQWRGHVKKLNGELLDRAAPTFTRLVIDQLLARATVKDDGLARMLAEQRRLRSTAVARAPARTGHHGSTAVLSAVDPYPPLDSIRTELSQRFAKRLVLWPHERATLAGFGSEMDRVLQMPGWTNVWTMPIQNRVDMLATGVNTEIGVRVLGGDLDQVVRTSEEIAAVLKRVPGAADVVADPIRGKGYLEVRPDREKLARLGIAVDDVNETVEAALAGKVATTIVAGRERHAVRVRYARDWRTDDEAVRNVLISHAVGKTKDGRRNTEDERGKANGEQSESTRVRENDAGSSATNQHLADITSSDSRLSSSVFPSLAFVPLDAVADVRITEGPATIKSENGMLRNYVRLNVRGRGVVDFVEEARRIVAAEVKLPAGVFVEWTGQFEHQVRARNTLVVVMPIVVGIIFLILYLTYRDWADAMLMMLAVPGAIAGGVFFQWLFGYKFSVTVWIGYIACFGMATATGIIMLVYLREAVERAGGLERISLARLRQAVMDGAVQRLRPKLLTEGTTIIGLAPMLWATGPGAEVIKPMAAPVLGGILVADEVIDLFLPVLFYWVRRWRWERIHGANVPNNFAEPSESSTETFAVPSSEAPNRLAEVGLIHSSFQPVGVAKEYGDETIPRGPT
jgi:Cu(I)/Ag(I) efflux system membrane protein CusA/SilA